MTLSCIGCQQSCNKMAGEILLAVVVIQIVLQGIVGDCLFRSGLPDIQRIGKQTEDYHVLSQSVMWVKF